MIAKIIAMVMGALGIMYFLRIIVECLSNLSILLDKKSYLDTTKKRKGGHVINKKTKKVEADNPNSIILPF